MSKEEKSYGNPKHWQQALNSKTHSRKNKEKNKSTELPAPGDHWFKDRVAPTDETHTEFYAAGEKLANAVSKSIPLRSTETWKLRFGDVSKLGKKFGAYDLFTLIAEVDMSNQPQIRKQLMAALKYVNLPGDIEAITEFYEALLRQPLNVLEALKPYLKVIQISVNIKDSVVSNHKTLGDLIDLAVYYADNQIKYPLSIEERSSVINALVSKEHFREWLSDNPKGLFHAFLFAKFVRRMERFLFLLKKVEYITLQGEQFDVWNIVCEMLEDKHLFFDIKKKKSLSKILNNIRLDGAASKESKRLSPVRKLKKLKNKVKDKLLSKTNDKIETVELSNQEESKQTLSSILRKCLQASTTEEFKKNLLLVADKLNTGGYSEQVKAQFVDKFRIGLTVMTQLNKRSFFGLIYLMSHVEDFELTEKFKKGLGGVGLERYSAVGDLCISELYRHLPDFLSTYPQEKDRKKVLDSIKPYLDCVIVETTVNSDKAKRKMSEFLRFFDYGQESPYAMSVEMLQKVIEGVKSQKSFHKMLRQDPICLFYAFIYVNKMLRRTPKFLPMLKVAAAYLDTCPVSIASGLFDACILIDQALSNGVNIEKSSLKAIKKVFNVFAKKLLGNDSLVKYRVKEDLSSIGLFINLSKSVRGPQEHKDFLTGLSSIKVSIYPAGNFLKNMEKFTPAKIYLGSLKKHAEGLGEGAYLENISYRQLCVGENQKTYCLRAYFLSENKSLLKGVLFNKGQLNVQRARGLVKGLEHLGFKRAKIISYLKKEFKIDLSNISLVNNTNSLFKSAPAPFEPINNSNEGLNKENQFS